MDTESVNRYFTTLPVAPPVSFQHFDKVNLNSAPLLVRRALMGAGEASGIYRPLMSPSFVFRAWDDIREMLGPDQDEIFDNLKEVFDFDTYTFSINARGRSKRAESTIRATYDFGPGGLRLGIWTLGREPELLSWREDL